MGQDIPDSTTDVQDRQDESQGNSGVIARREDESARGKDNFVGG